MSEEALYAELHGLTRATWNQLPAKRRESIIPRLEFVKRIEGARLYFNGVCLVNNIHSRIVDALQDICGSAEIHYFSSGQIEARRSADRFITLLEDPARFAKLNFGGDVAERDVDLLQYFISTKAFARVDSGSASVIIGPKGSGKTAILRALQAKRGSANSIIITPEIFATSMLRQVVEGSGSVWDEDQAFVSTWIFSILVEVFKRISANPKGVPGPALKSVRAFLRDNAKYEEVDIFTRFIGYLKRIEGVKVGNYEISLKTRMLQELYSLAPLYELVPKLRGVGGEMLILLDELDQGWDNTEHANRFIGSLLKAAIKIQYLGLKAQVVTFLRLEIFDLIKTQLDQLDKLRGSIEMIRWTDGELADLIVRRAAHSLSFTEKRNGFELEMAGALFDGKLGGMNCFEYLLSRTSLRPREVLQLLTHAHRIAVSDGAKKITAEVLKRAEEEFSSWKIEHMCSEYAHIYPGLNELLWKFRSRGPMLSLTDLNSILLDYKANNREGLPKWANCQIGSLLQMLVKIEFLGVPRPTPARHRSGLIANYEFAFEHRNPNVGVAETFLIQPALWAVLEIPAA